MMRTPKSTAPALPQRRKEQSLTRRWSYFSDRNFSAGALFTIHTPSFWLGTWLSVKWHTLKSRMCSWACWQLRMAYPNISGDDSSFNVELTNANEVPQRRQIGFEGYDKSAQKKSTESAKLLISDDGAPSSRPRLNTSERVRTSVWFTFSLCHVYCG